MNFSNSNINFSNSNVNFNKIEPSRQSERIKESNPFINIYAIENEASATNSPAVVYKFGRQVVNSVKFSHEMEKGDLTYAPSLRNPYYMSVPGSMFTLLAGDTSGLPQWGTESLIHRGVPSAEIGAFFYVSLKLLYDMANDEVNWESLSRLEDPQVPTTSDPETIQEAETLKEIAFGSLGDPPKKDPIDKQPYDPPLVKIIPDRKIPDKKMQIEEESKAGDPPRPKAYKASNSSSVINCSGVRREIKENAGPGVPPRLYIPIRHQRGWLIWIRKPDWSVHRVERRGQLRALKKIFHGLWMVNTATDPESAAGYRPRYSSADLNFSLYVVPQAKSLNVRLGWELVQIDTRFRELVKKINDGRSQLNTNLVTATDGDVTDWGLVKMGENPFGLFTTYITTADYNTYMRGLETLTGTALTLDRKDAHRVATKSLKDLKFWLESHYRPMPDDMYTKPQKDVLKLITASRKKSMMDIPDENPLYVEAAHGSTWRIIVSREKMKVAGGKRIADYAPSKIMGMSSNEAADEGFGWSKLDQAEQCLGHQHRLSNGMYMAEWLHLCAFSWGGLSASAESTELVYRTSDIPENLVLGTSETNSLMTRFEKAWQALVRDASHSATDDAGNSTFHARLVVARNDTKAVTWDMKNDKTNTYHRQDFPMSQTELQIAEQFHFVAYTVSYSIEFPDGCQMLSMGPGESLTTTFYPFLRPLYHRLEDQLDQMLYKEIRPKDLGEDITDSIIPAPNGITPIVTGGQILYDGTMGYGGAIDLGTKEHTTKDGGIARKPGLFKPYNMKGETIEDEGIIPKGKGSKRTKGHYNPI